MTTRDRIEFTKSAVWLGGASSVSWSKRYAWIEMPQGRTVRVPLKELPPRNTWNAFLMADHAYDAIEAEDRKPSAEVRRICVEFGERLDTITGLWRQVTARKGEPAPVRSIRRELRAIGEMVRELERSES